MVRRRKRTSKNKRKRIIMSLFLFILGVVVIGAISKEIGLLITKPVEAINKKYISDIIREEDIIREKLNKEIKKEEIKRIDKELADYRAKIRAEERRNNNQKIAYLTFDDGPSKKSTPAILDILSEYNIKATFFVVGNMVDTYPDIVKRTYEEGHKIGNHSYSHNYKYLYQNPKNFMNDIYKTEKSLKNILGKNFQTKAIRFPGGSFDRYKASTRKVAADAGYNSYDWNALNGDAEGPKRTKAQLVNRVKETTKNKNEVIILMHDTDAKDTTVQSLKEVIDYLISEGYEFDTLE